MTAADIRAACGRLRVPRYQLAGLVQLHPNILSKVLNEKMPLRPELCERLARALETFEHREESGVA